MLRDFQSWRRLDVDLAPITMIVGRGFTGKSAIVRAITYALTNQGGDGFIRHGAPKAQVGLAFDEGTALLWTKRRGAGAVYNLSVPVVGPVEFTKTGQSVPAEIEAAVGIRAITIDKNFSVYPQLHQQLDKPFLVDESGSRTARVLGKLTRLDVVVQAQMLCRKDKDAEQKRLQQLESEQERIAAQLKELPDVPALRDKFLEAAAAFTTAEGLSTALHAAERLELLETTRACVDTAREALNEAASLVSLVEEAEQLVQQRRRQELSYADAGLRYDRAEEDLQEIKEAHEAACQGLGLCESCPYRGE